MATRKIPSRQRRRSVSAAERARARAAWPHDVPTLRGKSVDVLLRMEKDIYDWVAGFSGDHNFFFSVEETIITALRGLSAPDGPNALSLIDLAFMAAEQRDVQAEDVLLGKVPIERRDAVQAMLSAALIAAGKGMTHTYDDLPADPADRARVEAILRAVGVPIPPPEEDIDWTNAGLPMPDNDAGSPGEKDVEHLDDLQI